MTVHVWFMGHDLKSHERTFPDGEIAENGTYRPEISVEYLIKELLRQRGDAVAEITDIAYEDD